MNKIKKILPIILSFVLVFGSCLTVSASSYPSDRTDAYKAIYSYAIANDLPIEKYQIFKFYTDSTEYYYLYTTDSMPYYTSNGNGKFLLSLDDNDLLTFHKYEYRASTGTINHSLHQITSSTSNIMIGDSAGVSTLQTVYYNYDLVKYGETNVWVTTQFADFFPTPPLAILATNLPEVVNSQVVVILTTAVACLALLVTLSVLRKKLPSFL